MPKKLFGNKKVEEQIVNLLKEKKIPCSIDFVALNMKMAWGTARSILLSLTIEGKIKSQKTTKGMIFWIDGELGKI